MNYPEFHNALRILMNIDQDELVNAGVLISGDHNAWGEFRRDPFRWFILVPDEVSEKVWQIIKLKEEKKDERETSGQNQGRHAL